VFNAERPEVLTACGTTVQVWDSTTYQLLKEVDNGAATLSAAFAPGRRSVLIVTQRKPFVYRWDLDGGKPVEFKFSGVAAGSADDGAHTDQVTGLALSSRGGRVVTASRDGSARLWDIAAGTPIDVLRHSDKAVMSAAISPDDRRIVTTSKDGSARLWRAFASTQDLIDSAKVDLPRCLTAEQRWRFGLEGGAPAWCRKLSKWPPPE
jgi:WD40 repeat protein